MGRRDFVSSKKKSAFLAMAKSQGGGSLKKSDGEEKSGLGGSDFSDLMNSIVFKDELRSYVTSIINNAEPNEYVYEDLRVAATATRAGGATPSFAAFPAGESTKTWLFSNSSVNDVHFSVQLPHAWMEGSEIEAHVHWAPTTTNTGAVAWQLDYTWASENGTFAAPTTLAPTPDAGDGTVDKHQYFDIGDIDGTGETISSMLICRLYRNTDAAGDTYTAAAALLEFDFHIKLDARGSSEETSK